MAVSPLRGSPRGSDALLRDLRLAREQGGLKQAKDAAFSATTDRLSASGQSDDRPAAEAFWATTLNQRLRPMRDDDGVDPCDRTAAGSLLKLLLRPAKDRDLAAQVRRDAAARFGCILSVDGVRKREDNLLRLVAVEADERLGPRKLRTIEEHYRLTHDDILWAYGVMSDGLRRLYRHSPPDDAPDRRLITLNMLFHAAWVQWWTEPIMAVHASGQPMTPAELLVLESAGSLALEPFGFSGDKARIRTILLTDGNQDDRNAFRQRLENDPELDGLITRFEQWATSCHDSCAYMRTYDLRLLCKPHHFVFCLWMELYQWDEYLSGELDDIARREFGYFPEIEA